MKTMRLDRIGGVIPALLTCFDTNENFDEQCQRSVVRFLLSKGVDGLYLTGSTGETFLMDGGDERKKVVEVVSDEVAGRVPIIVHVGDIGTKKSIKLAEHAISMALQLSPLYLHSTGSSHLKRCIDTTRNSVVLFPPSPP